MRRARRSSTAHTGWSAISGRIRVVDYRQERRLIVRGAILSAYPLDGDWSAIEREYWWQGVAAVRFPPEPSVLLVGLGGGTQAHLARLPRRRCPPPRTHGGRREGKHVLLPAPPPPPAWRGGARAPRGG